MTKDEIISVLKDLNRITGFRVSLHSSDYGEVAAYPPCALPFCEFIHSLPGEAAACAECDKAACSKALRDGRTVIYRCRFGLTEAISPLYNFGTLTGFLMMGQVRDSGMTAEMLSTLSDDPAVRDGLIAEIPKVDRDMINSYVNIMTVCAKYLTVSNAITIERPTVPEMAIKYISENYSKKIGIRELCDEIGCSKSTLLTSFREKYGKTINETLNDMRLDSARQRLSSGNGSISEIAEACGFSEQSYFTKVFSAKYGMPPSEYRRSTKDETDTYS